MIRAGQGLAVVFLLFFPVVLWGAETSVAVANQELELARASLAQAVERIRQDPPSNADLDAAHAAVGALKAAIDAGAEHEQSDLDYAKAALAARKELRTQRDYVDQRRGNGKLHEARRAMDVALKALNDSVARVQAKDPSPEDFEGARAAVDALKKIAEGARPFVKQDQKFATYLTETDAVVFRQQKALDERETQVAVEKQRALLEERRQRLKTAIAALGKDATDDQFHAGDKATSALSKQLEEGKPLEGKNPPYQTDADKARAELAQAKKTMDELWTAAGLARLKGEVEPAYRDLVAAGKAVRGTKPTADQLAEARTAAIVVRGLVEKFQPEATRSQVFGQYVDQVKKTLAEVESEVERRGLVTVKSDVVQAQRNIERKAPTDEQFQELNTAITILEKTLQTVHAKEPQMAEPVAQAQAVLRDAKAMSAKRRVEVDVGHQRTQVEDARKIAAEAMKQLQLPNFEKDQLPQAESAVKLLGSVLEQGADLTKKDREYAAYDREVKHRVDELNDKIAAKRVALAASEGRAALAEAISAARARIETAKAPEATDPGVAAAVESVTALTKAIEVQAPLEKQDRGYAGQADKARNELARLADLLEFAKLARDLRKKTGETLAAGAATADSGASLTDLRARKALYAKALDQFRSCQGEGLARVRSMPELGKLPVLVDGHPNTLREVTALCAQRAETTDQLLREVAPLIKFDEGPKKSYEAAKGLLDKSKKTEAVAQLSECIATGSILQGDSPELTHRTFEVAGGSMTLAELIKQCVSERKALQAK